MDNKKTPPINFLAGGGLSSKLGRGDFQLTPNVRRNAAYECSSFSVSISSTKKVPTKCDGPIPDTSSEGQFLDFIARDIEQQPECLTQLTEKMYTRALDATTGVVFSGDDDLEDVDLYS
jgi:hypothetical protein